METIANKHFSSEKVPLDDRYLVDCELNDCVLEYLGGKDILERTHFKGCSFAFGDGAARVVALLECFGIVNSQDLTMSAEDEVLN